MTPTTLPIAELALPTRLAHPVAASSVVVPASAADSDLRQRVCHISLQLSTGGLERLLVDFARFHNREQFDLHFLSLGALGIPAEEIRAAGCQVHALRPARRFGQLRALAAFLYELAPALVHTHNAYPQLYGSLAARWAGVPAVVNTRHGQRYGQTTKTRWQSWVAARFTDQVVTVSDDAASLSRGEDRISRGKVKRIWNGIDTDRFSFRGSAPLNHAISVARLSPEKDFATLLQAVKLAARLVPDFQLSIVGEGNEGRTLRRLARELKIAERVEFLGERRDVPELLGTAGFFVSSSLTEGISLTLREAMASGLPILATSVGGNPEVVVDAVTGKLVPPANADALAAGIVQMCRHRADWPEMGRLGRQRVCECFEVRRMVREYEQVYAEVLAARSHTNLVEN
jgi:glycosyltransferase involved in cell wall biosynthesis